MSRPRILLLPLLLFSVAAFAQRSVTDSLRGELSKAKQDTAIARAAGRLGFAFFRNTGELDSAIKYMEFALSKLDHQTPTALLSETFCNTGLMYREKGIYDKALECYMKALKAAEKINDDKKMAQAYNGIGISYAIQRRFEKARDYYFKCVAIYKKLDNKKGLAGAYNNIGLSYFNANELSEALGNFTLSLMMHERNKDNVGIATASENIGLLYMERKEYQKALDCYARSLKIWRALEDVNSQAITLGYAAQTLNAWDKPQQAIDTCLKAMELSKKAGSISNERDLHGFLSTAYEKLKQHEKALFHHKEYRRLADSLNNEESHKEMADIRASYKYDKQLMRDSLRMSVEVEKKEMALQQEKNYKYGLLIILGLLFAFAVVVYRGYRHKKRAGDIIALQKKMVEAKNKEVFDSINYAKKLQDAIFPPENVLHMTLKDHFILYEPKDIVSGDFYWVAQKGNYVFYATADCTGHGVPGGFMSMLGTTMLNEIVNEKNITEPAEILNLLREKIVQVLNQEYGSGEHKDGMDMVLCRLNKERNELVYAGANNPVWIIRNGENHKYLPDKQPIGVTVQPPSPFKQQTIPLQKGDIIYSFSDGYADQFGGPKGKKFKYKQLEAVLVANYKKVMADQRRVLGDTLNAWKGGLEQVDDILVMGIRV